MECRIVSNKLSACLDGELREPEARAVREHLVSCGRCAEEFRSLAKLWALIPEVPRIEPRADLWPSIEQRLQAGGTAEVSLRGLLCWRPFAVLATLVLVVGLYLGSAAGRLLIVTNRGSFIGSNLEPAAQIFENTRCFGDVPPGSLAEGVLEVTTASSGSVREVPII